MAEIEFEEDLKSGSSWERRKPLPKKGLEAAIYKKIPGKYDHKKFILFLVVIGLFVASFVFFVLGLKNVEDDKKLDFYNRVNNTRSK